MNKVSTIRAFALGYYDGRAEGVYDCPFENDDNKLSYRDGYEAGVADYCDETHPEDNETLEEAQ
jgi:hypothetical protein